MLSACNACVHYAISVNAGMVPAEVSGVFVPVTCVKAYGMNAQWKAVHYQLFSRWLQLCDTLQPASKIGGQGIFQKQYLPMGSGILLQLLSRWGCQQHVLWLLLKTARKLCETAVDL